MDKESLITGIQDYISARGGVLWAAQVTALVDALLPEPAPEPPADDPAPQPDGDKEL